MGLRPAKCYKRIEKPYTRVSQRKPKESYVVGVPMPKITRFVAGNMNKEFDTLVRLVSEQAVQIRHNAMEAVRIAMVKYLGDSVTTDGFYLRIRPYPHHVLREHSLATGAGADRFSSGMRRAFGRPVGKAAQIREGQVMVDIFINSANLKHAKEAFRLANAKLPTKCRVIVSTLPKPALPQSVKVA